MMRLFKFGYLLSALLLAGYLLGGCQPVSRGAAEASREEVCIPVIFTANPKTGERGNEELAESFNHEYQGIYRLEVTWMMETEEEYRQNLKRLNVTDNLPAVITDLRMLPSLYETMMTDRRIIDLKPYLERDSEWLTAIEPQALEACRADDGGIYLMNEGSSIFTCSGVFWNEELFARAGIDRFPVTWDAFWEVCDQLSHQGITPLALHTAGTAWAPLLLATANAGCSSSGYEFMQLAMPETYQNESGEQIAKTLRRLFTYTTDDALHADFDVAYVNFFSGNAAMIPNGYWMLADIPEEWQEKIRFSCFPEKTLISSPESFGWAVTDTAAEIREGAIAFLKYRTFTGRQKRAGYLETDRALLPRAEADYLEAFLEAEIFVPNYQVKWNSIFQEQVLGFYLPQLVEDEISIREFLEAADRSIREYNQEQ